MKATVMLSRKNPARFTLTLRQSGVVSSVTGMDCEKLVERLREWSLGERAVATILNLPLGAAVTFTLGGTRANDRPPHAA